jgi:hypothetical protein
MKKKKPKKTQKMSENVVPSAGSAGSNSALGARLLASGCLLVDNIDVVTSFITQVFFDGSSTAGSAGSGSGAGTGTATSSVEIVVHPVRHSVIRIEQSEEAIIVLIARSSCNSAQLSYFKEVASSRQLFVAVKDPLKVQKRAISAGAQIGDYCNDDSGAVFCTFEGPEDITFTVMNKIKSKRQCLHELIMTMSCNQQDEDGLISPTSSYHGGRPPPPPNMASPRTKKMKPRYVNRIPTLEVSILSNGPRKEYVPCPANNREPIPFETELFKGIALLVVRTKPVEDPLFDSYFNGPKR